MRIIRRILCGLMLTGILAAQDTAPPPAETRKPEPPRQQRIFQLKYADARDVANVLEVFGFGIKPNHDLHVVAVSAPADVMAAVEDAVKRMDVPAAAPKDIDLTVYLVVASEQSSNADSLPPELQAVSSELKRIFAYKSFRQLDSILLRSQPGRQASASGATSEHSHYSFAATPTAVTDDAKGRLIRLDNLRLDLLNTTISIHTEITVREGQRVVVGKTNMSADQALILVLTAKVAE